MSQHTWLITGSSRGFGRALSLAALEAGDQVVATARTPSQLDDLVERHGDLVLAVALDVTDSAAAGSALEAALARLPRLRTWQPPVRGRRKMPRFGMGRGSEFLVPGGRALQRPDLLAK